MGWGILFVLTAVLFGRVADGVLIVLEWRRKWHMW